MTLPSLNWSNFLDQYIQPIDIRKRRKCDYRSCGKTSKLPVNQYIEVLFQYNEMLAMKRFLDPDCLPLTNLQILENFKREFGGKHAVNRAGVMAPPGNSILTGKHKIGWKRIEYRRGDLYKSQVRPFLMSFSYFKDGNIVTDTTRTRPTYPTFRECQSMCIEAKICDPRFFDIETMERMHQAVVKEGSKLAWRFPTISELENLRKIIPIDPYRSVKTYDLHKKRNTHQEKAKTDLREREEALLKETPKKEKAFLEEQRRKTQAAIDNIQQNPEPEPEDPYDEDHSYGWGGLKDKD